MDNGHACRLSMSIIRILGRCDGLPSVRATRLWYEFVTHSRHV